MSTHTTHYRFELKTTDGEISVDLSRPFSNCWRFQVATESGELPAPGAAQRLSAALGEPEPGGAETMAVDEADLETRVDGALAIRPDGITFSCGSGSARLRLDSASFQVDLRPDEALFGLGERFDACNQRGRVVRVWSEDRWCQTEGNSYCPVPLVLSSAGYGLFLNRYEASKFDLDSEGSGRLTCSTEGTPIDVYLFIDESPSRIVRSYVDLTGHSPMPPEWAFGVHVCRHARLKEFGTKEGVREMVRRMQEGDLPWTSVILEGWTAFDADRLTELQELAAELHALGKKVLIYERCGRLAARSLGDRADSSEGVNLLTKSGIGTHNAKTRSGDDYLADTKLYNPADAPSVRESVFLDVTSSHALEWWFGEVMKPLVEEGGIEGAKIDFCEQFPENDDVALQGVSSPTGLHHFYPVYFNALMYRYFNEKRPDGGMCFSRGGGIGAQRYPVMWAGDQLREYRFLRAILVASLSSGLSGIPFMCHDLGAYMPARDPENNPEPEVFVRGAQLACFSPAMQTHGIVTRPYDFDEPIVAQYRLYSRVHYALLPYIIEQARVCCETGLPLMRHLHLSFPRDARCAQTEDQFLFGDALLVAPMLERGESRDVYLPAGQWEALASAESYDGPTTLAAYRAPLESIPVFVRKDAHSPALAQVLNEVRQLLATNEARAS